MQTRNELLLNKNSVMITVDPSCMPIVIFKKVQTNDSFFVNCTPHSDFFVLIQDGFLFKMLMWFLCHPKTYILFIGMPTMVTVGLIALK